MYNQYFGNAGPEQSLVVLIGELLLISGHSQLNFFVSIFKFWPSLPIMGKMKVKKFKI